MALADGRASKHPISSGSNQEINQDGKTKRVRKVQNSKWEWKFGTIGEIIRGLMDTLTRYGMIKLNLGEDLQVCHADYIASRGRSWWNHQHSQLQLKFISEAIIVLWKSCLYQRPSSGATKRVTNISVQSHHITSMMPQNMKREWTEKLQPDGMKSFNFEFLFQHLSKDGTKHSFDSII